MPDVNMSVFEEAKRNQLVTEIDIQTQAALDDYQVRLSDITNPTQSQDNVIIDRFGEFLPHWNESLDFDTWVKMSMEVAGKKLLMLRGNSNINNINSISNTFIFGDDVSDGDISDWTDTGQTGRVTASSGIYKNTPYSFQHNTAITYGTAYKSFTEQTNTFIFEADVYSQSDNSGIIIGEGTLYNNHDGAGMYFYNGNIEYISDAGAQILQSRNLDQWYHVKWIINPTTQNVKIYIDGSSALYDGDMRGSSAFLKVHFGVYTAGGVGNYDNLRIRKYASTEPIYTINIPKNISTALKLLGRAG